MTDAILIILEESGHLVCNTCKGNGEIFADETDISVCLDCGGAGVVSTAPVGVHPADALEEALEFVMPFGTHVGRTLRNIEDSDKGYMDWMLKNMEEGELPIHVKLICDRR